MKSARLRCTLLGVAYAMRGLAYINRGNITGGLGDLNAAITARRSQPLRPPTTHPLLRAGSRPNFNDIFR